MKNALPGTIAIVLAAATLNGVSLGQERKNLDLADLIEKTEPACVRIDVTLKDGSEGIGSGFVVDAVRKWVVTNYHVVADSKTASVEFADGTKAKVRGWRAHYTDKDLALLVIDTDRELTSIPVAADVPRKGEKTVAIGTPQGLSFTVTEGIVSAIRDGKELHQFSEHAGSTNPDVKKFLFTGTWLQTSTPISPGSSGGPLLNMKGEVVGINSGSLASGQNINFAVSCPEIQRLVNVAKGIRMRDLTLLTPPPKTTNMRSSPSGGRPAPRTGERPTQRGGKMLVRLPSKRRFRHRYKIENEEDEFDKVTVLRSEWLPVKHNNAKLTSLGVRVSVVFDDEEVMPLAIWEVGVTSRGFQFLGRDSGRLQVLGGDESYELPQGPAERKVANGGTSEIMKGITGIDDFVNIVLTDKVKARLGTTEMEFDRSQIECLRDLASQIPAGEFFDGKLKIEHLEPEDDPTSGRKR